MLISTETQHYLLGCPRGTGQFRASSPEATQPPGKPGWLLAQRGAGMSSRAAGEGRSPGNTPTAPPAQAAGRRGAGPGLTQPWGPAARAEAAARSPQAAGYTAAALPLPPAPEEGGEASRRLPHPSAPREGGRWRPQAGPRRGHACLCSEFSPTQAATARKRKPGGGSDSPPGSRRGGRSGRDEAQPRGTRTVPTEKPTPQHDLAL